MMPRCWHRGAAGPGRGVNWAEYAGGGERRLAAGQAAISVCAHGRGIVCGGLCDGLIRVWNRATLEVERTLTGHTGAIWEEHDCDGSPRRVMRHSTRRARRRFGRAGLCSAFVRRRTQSGWSRRAQQGETV